MKDTDALTHLPLAAPHDPRVAGHSGWIRFETRQRITAERARPWWGLTVAAVAVLGAGTAFGACMPRTDAPTRSRLYPGKPRLPAWASASAPDREALGQPSRQWADADNRASDPWQLGWRGRRGVAGSYTPPPRVADMPPLTPDELTEALRAGPPYVELAGSNELIFEHDWIQHDVPAPQLEALPGILPLTEFEKGLVRLFAGEPISVFCDERGPVAYWIPHRMGWQFGGHVVGRDGEVFWMLLPRPAYRVEPGSYVAFIPLPIPLDKLARPVKWGWRGARGAVLVAVHLGRIAMSAARRVVGRTHYLVRAMRVSHAVARVAMERELRVLAERAVRAAGKAARRAQAPSARAERGISRLPHEVFGRMHGVSDRAGSRRRSRLRVAGCCLLRSSSGSAPRSDSCLSRLNTRPASPPVNASPLRSPAAPHDSGLPWFAKPSISMTFTLTPRRF